MTGRRFREERSVNGIGMRTMSPCLGFIPVLVVERVVPKVKAALGCGDQVITSVSEHGLVQVGRKKGVLVRLLGSVRIWKALFENLFNTLPLVWRNIQVYIAKDPNHEIDESFASNHQPSHVIA